MSIPQVIQGTSEELATVLGRFADRSDLMLIVPAIKLSHGDRPFYETSTADEWSAEMRRWAASHATSSPLLSDEAVERSSIYEER
jgi:hypothetical protein